MANEAEFQAALERMGVVVITNEDYLRSRTDLRQAGAWQGWADNVALGRAAFPGELGLHDGVVYIPEGWCDLDTGQCLSCAMGRHDWTAHDGSYYYATGSPAIRGSQPDFVCLRCDTGAPRNDAGDGPEVNSTRPVEER